MKIKMVVWVANLVLQDTIERIFVQDLYADIPRGIFLVRGENVLLLGEIVGAFSLPGPITLLEHRSPNQDTSRRIWTKMTIYPNLTVKRPQRRSMLYQPKKQMRGNSPTKPSR